MPEELPSPQNVKAVFTRLSELVQKANDRMVNLAKSYGIHGDPIHGTLKTYRVTRVGETWGIYASPMDPMGATLEICHGIKIEAKIELLQIVDEIEREYLKKVAVVFKSASRFV